MSSIPTDGGSSETILTRLLENDDILKEMLSMPRSVNENMVQERRIEMFRVLWREMDLSREFVLNYVQEREDDFISEYGEVDDTIPEWLLRMEAQDVLMKHMTEEIEAA